MSEILGICHSQDPWENFTGKTRLNASAVGERTLNALRLWGGDTSWLCLIVLVSEASECVRLGGKQAFYLAAPALRG